MLSNNTGALLAGQAIFLNRILLFHAFAKLASFCKTVTPIGFDL